MRTVGDHVALESTTSMFIGHFALGFAAKGGVIGLDARGNVTMSFNTTGMGRGYVDADGKPTIMFTVDDGK